MKSRRIVIVIVLIVLVILSYYAITRKSKNVTGVIIGERIAEANKDSLQLQTVKFNSPSQIFNSEYFLISVGVKEFSKPQKMSGDFHYKTVKAYNSPMSINLIFLDKDYNVIRRLLDKPASISRYFIPQDYTKDGEINHNIKNILYLIGTEDTNGDDRLNPKDFHDLYISDLDGSNLKKITSNYEVMHYEFIKEYSQVLIRLKEREAEREEYKKSRLVIYDIETEKITELDSLNEQLNEIEKQLNSSR